MGRKVTVTPDSLAANKGVEEKFRGKIKEGLSAGPDY